uniref:Uncharacterized protein n=1 Tax=Panagrolaimus davidi TaxID=227884 RepID=A0A914R246_9BILA
MNVTKKEEVEKRWKKESSDTNNNTHSLNITIQEPEVQPPRSEEKFTPTQQPPTCVMIERDTVTNLVNENYELMKKLQKEGRKPELFDMVCFSKL